MFYLQTACTEIHWQVAFYPTLGTKVRMPWPLLLQFWPCLFNLSIDSPKFMKVNTKWLKNAFKINPVTFFDMLSDPAEHFNSEAFRDCENLLGMGRQHYVLLPALSSHCHDVTSRQIFRTEQDLYTMTGSLRGKAHSMWLQYRWLLLTSPVTVRIWSQASQKKLLIWMNKRKHVKTRTRSC